MKNIDFNKLKMKKLVFLLLLCVGITQAQIVNIPDAYFKAQLLAADNINHQIASTQIPDANGVVTSYNTIDTNGDGEIQVSEALAIKFLRIYPSQISSFEGIASFTSLQLFDCSSQYISSLFSATLDISALTNLIRFNCSYNYIPSLNISGLINLKYLNCINNQLTSLDVSGLTSLEYIYCSSNQLTNLDISGLTNLKLLNCSGNNLQNLNLLISTSNTNNLTKIDCTYNQLSSLDTSNLINLVELYCSFNQISDINVTGLINLLYFECTNNLISNLDVSGLSNLKIMNCSFNQIPNINISGLINLEQLDCSNNQLSNLNIYNLTNLMLLHCENNNLTTLDCSNNHNLAGLGIAVNQISTLFIKNGSDESFAIDSGSWIENFLSGNNPNLVYICADNDDIANIAPYIDAGVVLNTYCSFTPGGSYHTITGNIKYDLDNNGCDNNDENIQNLRININDGTTIGATFSNTNGIYNFYTNSGLFNLIPQVENPTYFNISPASALLYISGANNTTIQDFCVAPNGTHNNVEIVLMPITPLRPGFDAQYKIVYKNIGNQIFSGNISLTFDSTKMQFVSASQTPDFSATNFVNWLYSNLLPFETRTILVTLHTNSPTDNPAVNGGDILQFTAFIDPMNVDEDITNNTFVYNQMAVNSFDPNAITCLEGNNLPTTEIGKYLHYVIDFENTGNFAAENVVVKTEIDATKYDVNTLQLIDSSHPNLLYTRIVNNKVEFIFQNINLAAAGGTPPVGGHGNVLFKIKSKNDLINGDFVERQANIFFDYNAPIDTNIAHTVYQNLSNTIHEFDTTIKVYPNPAHNTITIDTQNNIKSIEIYDAQGRLVQTKMCNAIQTTLDISSYTHGVYFLKTKSDKGENVNKIVKE